MAGTEGSSRPVHRGSGWTRGTRPAGTPQRPPVDRGGSDGSSRSDALRGRVRQTTAVRLYGSVLHHSEAENRRSGARRGRNRPTHQLSGKSKRDPIVNL